MRLGFRCDIQGVRKSGAMVPRQYTVEGCARQEEERLVDHPVTPRGSTSVASDFAFVDLWEIRHGTCPVICALLLLCGGGFLSKERRKELKKKLSLGPRDPHSEQGFSGHLRRCTGEMVGL